LRANIAEQRKFLEEGKIDKYHSVAVDFHEQIVRISQNATLQRLLASIFAQIRAMRVQRNSAPMHLPKSCDDHEGIIQAIEDKNPALAERVMRDHIRDLMSVLKREQEKAPVSSLRGRSLAAP